MPFVGCVQPRFRSRWSITQRGVRSDGVVMDAPAFGQHTQLLDRVEEFSVEELIPQLSPKWGWPIPARAGEAAPSLGGQGN
jgi:hypothetical protein